jgi:aryl-alcohol dehydrogenase-like predicted oxidoreductase
LEESVRAIGLLLRQGKVLYWGLSNYSLEETADVVRLCDGLGVERPVSMQPKYNMFHREVENSLVDFCEANGMGLIVYSPLDQGLLTGKYRKSSEIPDDSRLQTFDSRKTDEMLAEDNLDAVEALLKIAEQCGVTLVQLALAWVLRRTAVSSAICGATKVSQLESNVTASGVELSEETLAGVEEVLRKRRARIRIRDHEKTLRQGK